MPLGRQTTTFGYADVEQPGNSRRWAAEESGQRQAPVESKQAQLTSVDELCGVNFAMLSQAGERTRFIERCFLLRTTSVTFSRNGSELLRALFQLRTAATRWAASSVREYGEPRKLGTGKSFPRSQQPLKCRCDCFQVLSRCLTAGSLWQNRLHEPTSSFPIVGVEHCGLFCLDALQPDTVLVLIGGTHCQGAEADNSRSNQHCREQTFDYSFVLLHKLGSTGRAETVKRKREESVDRRSRGAALEFSVSRNPPTPSIMGPAAICPSNQQPMLLSRGMVVAKSQFGAREAMIAPNRGSPRSGSHRGLRRS